MIALYIKNSTLPTHKGFLGKINQKTKVDIAFRISKTFGLDLFDLPTYDMSYFVLFEVLYLFILQQPSEGPKHVTYVQ